MTECDDDEVRVDPADKASASMTVEQLTCTWAEQWGEALE
jgi:hypothetical protein